MNKLDPAKLHAVATVLAEEMLGHADPDMVAAIVREVEAQFASGAPARPATPAEQLTAQLLEQRTDQLLERIGQAVALVDVPRSSARH